MARMGGRGQKVASNKGSKAMRARIPAQSRKRYHGTMVNVTKREEREGEESEGEEREEGEGIAVGLDDIIPLSDMAMVQEDEWYKALPEGCKFGRIYVQDLKATFDKLLQNLVKQGDNKPLMMAFLSKYNGKVNAIIKRFNAAWSILNVEGADLEAICKIVKGIGDEANILSKEMVAWVANAGPPITRSLKTGFWLLIVGVGAIWIIGQYAGASRK